MTNKEAIERVEWARNIISNTTFSPETIEALDIAIKALDFKEKLSEWLIGEFILKQSSSGERADVKEAEE